MKKYNEASVFEQIKAGLEDSIAYSTVKRSLVSAKMPAPPWKNSCEVERSDNE